MLRAEAEERLREVRMESDCCKARLANLQKDFKKMEEMVHSMIQFKNRIEQLKHEKSTLTVSYENKMRKFQTYIASLEKENYLLLNELKSIETTTPESCPLLEEQDPPVTELLLERLRLLEQENTSLALENEQQKKQYERCLDDVANQVVQALLVQKSLREECAKLQCCVQDLEEQNQALTLLFRQRFLTQSSKESDECWATSSEGGLGTEGGTRLQASPSEQNLKWNVRKSEDSTESLPSLCSDYSLQSCASGAHNVTACSKLSSPPHWLREKQLSRPVCAATSLLCERALRATSSTQLGLWASLLQRHDCLMASATGPRDDSHLMSYQKLSCLNRSPRQPEDWLNLDFSQSQCSKRRSLPLSDHAQSEVGDLDSMETPSDKSFSFENLPVMNSSKIFGGSFSTNGALQKASKVPADSGASVFYQLHRSGNLSRSLLFAAPPRPNTLNIVPHIMGDPTHNFSFRALEKKMHQVNSSGNVYEDIDIPTFPESTKSEPGLLICSQFTNETSNCDNEFLPQMTNTVVRRHDTFDSFKRCLEEKGGFFNIPSPPLPLPVDASSHHHLFNQNECPNTSKNGKDEGYSTMSSDVQAENNAPGVDYTISPLISSEVLLQPHLVTMLSSDALMVSSTDSGLSLQLKCAQAKRQESQDEESFDLQLDSSLLSCYKDLDDQNEEANESGQLDSGLGGSPSIHKISSFKDHNDPVSMLEDRLLEDLRCHRTTLDYDKILTLLTPRGFKPSDASSRPPSIQNISMDMRVETAEKSTFTEPEDALVGLSSQGSLLSNHLCTKFTETISCASTCSMDCLDRPDHGLSTVKMRNRSSREWHDLLDVYCVSCKHCRLHNRQPHKLKFASRLEALGSLLRAFSDSHLVMRRPGDGATIVGIKADSLGNRCPPLRLNLLPLERHCSAFDLSPQSEMKSLSTHYQSNMQHHVEGDASKSCPQDVQQLESLEGAVEGSLSMSTVHSSTSSSGGEMMMAASAEDEDVCTPPAHYAQELTSDSENDILEEGNSFVEQWLEQGTAPLSQRIQNGYEYDEEEIGNWSLQLSSEDLSQSSVLTSVQWSSEWSSSQNDSVQVTAQPTSGEGNRLASIRENDLEGDGKDRLRGILVTRENPARSDENITEKRNDCGSETKVVEVLDNHGCVTKEGSLLKVMLGPAMVRQTNSAVPETEDDLQFEVAEFNRDFYRLCSMDSSRSLDMSVRSLIGGGVCSCPDPQHHRHVHTVEEPDNAFNLGTESGKSGAKHLKTKRSHVTVTGKETKSKEKCLKGSVERRKSGSRSRERVQNAVCKMSEDKKAGDKTKIPVVARSVPGNHHQSKRSSIPRRDMEDRLKKLERNVTPKSKQSETGKATSPLRPCSNIMRVTGSRVSGSSDSTKRMAVTRTHSKDKKRQGHVHIPKECEMTPAKQNRVPGEKMYKNEVEARNLVELSLEAVEVLKKSCPDRNNKRWKRSKEGCGTSWVHFEADVDLSDPKARANLLDSMMASSSSGSSSDGEELVLVVREQGPDGVLVGEEAQVQQHQHLHALHRIRRHKKRVTDPDAVLSFLPRLRASIIDRHEFYYRFGEKEREAVACFDFLNDLSTSPSDVDTADNAKAGKTNNNTIMTEGNNRLSLDETKLFSCQNSPHNSFSSATLNSQECDHISFSDSCAESYSSTQSLNRVV